ncbi:MarR family winged helix-turn-helix transcriptional regulator [Brachybacterium sp. FME24]|uniref:MarR family winged helix-turn-helix transcriptional regulator n=1 Tax=Brachybacterium sp. FME24 TaxID=2742605 RepID=UPI001868CB86|nr:MarR family transcriptional regulator [Brachybacterium sp. FME24]
MTSPERDDAEPRALPSVYTVAGSDPHSELVDRTGMSAADIASIDELMAALVHLRAAEKELSEASLRYMKLGETDMRALHFLIVCENTGTLATPSAIAQHLGISSASTTKLLDRLESGGHIHREQHPSDRRALAIVIEPSTRSVAMRTVGAQQARRVHAARRLTLEERGTVTAFLEDMTAEISVEGIEWFDGPTEDAGTG